MPLLAYTHSGEPLVAPLLSDDEWEQLRSSKDRDAWMPGSQRRAIPKVSRLGTRFFARPPGHASRAQGKRRPSLPQSAVPDRSQSCGLGSSPGAVRQQHPTVRTGGPMCCAVVLARPGALAIEAQVQLQGEEAYRQRQERYAASGIRALWLVAHEPAALHSYWHRQDQHLPAFRTSIWKDHQGRPGADVDVDGSSVSMAEFVSGALSGQLHWYENDRHGIVTLLLREDQCWHRTCRNKVLLAFTAETPHGEHLDLQTFQGMRGYDEAYAKAQMALPDLGDSPLPFRQALASRCPHCRREIRYQRQGWRTARCIRVPIGVAPAGPAGRLGLIPHAQWHWGPQDQWTHWAPIGGIGAISHGPHGTQAKRLHPNAGGSPTLL